mgnify:CR=1 FL=1
MLWQYTAHATAAILSLEKMERADGGSVTRGTTASLINLLRRGHPGLNSFSNAFVNVLSRSISVVGTVVGDLLAFLDSFVWRSPTVVEVEVDTVSEYAVAAAISSAVWVAKR